MAPGSASYPSSITIPQNNGRPTMIKKGNRLTPRMPCAFRTSFEPKWSTRKNKSAQREKHHNFLPMFMSQLPKAKTKAVNSKSAAICSVLTLNTICHHSIYYFRIPKNNRDVLPRVPGETSATHYFMSRNVVETMVLKESSSLLLVFPVFRYAFATKQRVSAHL